MHKNFRQKVENILGCEISDNEFRCAISAVKDDAFSNNILMGKEVSPEYFIQKVCEYVKCLRRFTADENIPLDKVHAQRVIQAVI